MAKGEIDNRGFAEKSFTGVRDAALVVALFGAIVLTVAAPIGATVFWGGAAGAGAGELGRRAAASGKPKSGG